MALTETEIRASITKLETALARGEDTVQFADRMVRYRTPSALKEALDYFKKLLEDATGGRPRQLRVRTCRGF